MPKGKAMAAEGMKVMKVTMAEATKGITRDITKGTMRDITKGTTMDITAKIMNGITTGTMSGITGGTIIRAIIIIMAGLSMNYRMVIGATVMAERITIITTGRIT